MQASEFDEFPYIVYSDIVSLYFGKFPYKVSMDAPPPRGGQSGYLNHRACRADCPADKTTWRSSLNSNWSLTPNFSFFFLYAEDAKRFIQLKKNKIREVFRARDDKEITLLRENSHKNLITQLRRNLYWNRYKYCIEFLPQCPLEEEDILSQNILGLFSRKDKRRYFYVIGYKPRLYLNNNRDVLYVYIALSDKIYKQYQAVLRDNNEY